MKKTVVAWLVSLLLLTGTVFAENRESGNSFISVFPVINNTNSQNDAHVIYNELLEAIEAHSLYSVLPQKQMESIVALFKLQLAGYYREEGLPTVGQLQAADYFITSELNFLDGEYHFNITCTHQETGKVLFIKNLHSRTVTGIVGFFPSLMKYLDQDYKKSEDMKNSILYLVTVGIDDYKQKRNNLKFAVSDARAISERLKDKAGNQYRNIYGLEIHNESATQDNILENLEIIGEVIQPEDVLIFYYAGHGIIKDNESYLVTHEARMDSEERESWGLPLRDLLLLFRQFETNKIVVIFDAAGMQDDLLQYTSDNSGVVFITASEEEGFVFEGQQWGGRIVYPFPGIGHK